MVGIRDTVEEARVPLIGSNASPPSLQSVVYIWRTSYVLDEPGRALGPLPARPTARRTAGSRSSPRRTPRSHDVVNGFREGFGADDPRIIGAPVTYTTATPTPARATYTADDHQGARPATRRRSSASSPGPPRWSSSSSFAQPVRRRRSTHPASSPRAPSWTNLEATTALGIQTALNYSADLNNDANRVFASAYRKKYHGHPHHVRDGLVRRGAGARQGDPAGRRRSPRPQQVNLALGKIGQIDSPRGSGSSTSRVPRSRSGTCARCSATVRCCPTC